MKKVLSGTFLLFLQMKSDPMMLAACFASILLGVCMDFGIPFFEKASQYSLINYYPVFDLLLSIMAPVLLCFAFAMITLEETDDKISRYFTITPLGRSGYLFTRLGVPALISAVIAFVELFLFNLEDLSLGMMLGLSVLGSIQALIVSLMIITLSTNKLEGMAVTKLSALTLLGIPVPFFIEGGYQYLAFFLPSFWAGKAVQEDAYSCLLIALMAAFVWITLLSNKLLEKLAG